MRLLLTALLALLLTGCSDQKGRYQIAAAGPGEKAAWRVDTVTGEVSLCGIRKAGEKVTCIGTN